VNRGADRADHRLALFGRKQEPAFLQFPFQVIEQIEQFRARGLAVDRTVFKARRGRNIGCTEPFICREQHRLTEINGGKMGSGNRDDAIAQRDFIIVEPGTLVAEQDADFLAACRGHAQSPGGFRRREHVFGDAALARGGRINNVQIGHCLAQSGEHAGFLDDIRRARRHRHRLGIRPAVARVDEPQIGKPKIRHCARRGADVLAKLRVREDDGWREHWSL